MLAGMVALAAFPLGGCSKDNVVVEPVALRPVSAHLLAPPDVPNCTPQPRADYSPDEVLAYAKCWRAAYDALFAKHKGLAKAVAFRQQQAAKAAQAAKS